MRNTVVRLIQTVAILATLVLLASFGLYGLDQASGASQNAQTSVNTGRDITAGPAMHAPAHNTLRQAVDDVNAQLVSPFATFAPGDPSSWSYHLITLLCGVLLYGLGLGLLARSLRLSDRGRRSSGPKTPSSGPPVASNPWADAKF